MSEHINRLKAARFQWDMMGTENLLIARTDSESGKLISSTVDARDHEYILGVTEDIEPLASVLQRLELEGATGTDIDKYEAEWVKRHELVTFDEGKYSSPSFCDVLLTQLVAAVQHLRNDGADDQTIDSYKLMVDRDRNMSLSRRRSWVNGQSKTPICFSWDVPRTREGYYHYRAGLQAATKRAIEFAPYADLLWLETADPNVQKAAGFAESIRKVYPGKQLVYNLSPSFNWMGQGFDEASLKSFIWDLAKHGFDHHFD